MGTWARRPTIPEEDFDAEYRKYPCHGWGRSIGDIIRQRTGYAVVREGRDHWFRVLDHFPRAGGRTFYELCDAGKIVPAYSSPYTTWWYVRDLIAAFGPRPRCSVCGRKWRPRPPQQIGGWTWGASLTECSVRCERIRLARSIRHHRQERRERTWLREGKTLLKTIRALTRNPSQLEALRSQTAGSAPPVTSGTS